MSAFVESLAGKTRDSLVNLSEVIINNLQNGCKAPTNEDLAVLHDIMLTEIQTGLRCNSSVSAQSSRLEVEKHHELDTMLLSFCGELLHLLSHMKDRESPSFSAISKCVLLCYRSIAGCSSLLKDFFVLNIQNYIASVKDGTQSSAVITSDIESVKFYHCPEGGKVPSSVIFQLLHVLCKDEPQMLPLNECTNHSWPNLREDNEIFETLLEVIYSGVDDAVLAAVSQIIKIHLCDYSRKKALWNKISHLSRKETEKTVSYGMACLVIDDFLCGTEDDIRNDKSLREFIQSGLVSADSLTRKRAMYILKRVLNAPSMTEDKSLDALQHWMQLDEFILLFETLEEKQLHVMLPVLPSVAKVIQLSSQSIQNSLHISWLATILTRGINHESKVITKWAVETTLHLQVGELHYFKYKDWKFICQTLINAFKEFGLFEKEDCTNVSQPPSIVNKLENFFQQCKIAAVKEGQEIVFFRQVITSLCASECNALTFPYVVKALSKVEIPGLIDLQLLSIIKAWMLSETSMYPAQLKAATYGILLKIVCSSLNEELTLVDLIKFSRFIFDSGYLSYGTEPWIQLTKGLSAQLFNLTWSKRGAHAIESEKSLCQLFTTAFGDYFSGRNLDFENEVEIVLLFFLTIYFISDWTGGEKLDSLSIILGPFMSSLGKIGRNPYVTPEEVSRCLSVGDLILRCCFQSKHQIHLGNIILREILKVFVPCFATFGNLVKETFVTNMLDASKVQPFLKLHKTICTFINTIHDFDLSSFHTIIPHFETLCKLCCQHASTFDAATDNRVINLTFQIMETLCAVIEKRCFQSSIETKTKLERLLFGTIAKLNLQYKSYCSSEHFKSSSSVKNGFVNDSQAFEGSSTISHLWSMVSFAINSPIIKDTEFQNPDASILTLRTSSVATLVNNLVDTLDVSVGSDIVPILHCLKILVPEAVEFSDDLAMFVLESVWRVLMEQERRDSKFWKIYKPSVAVIFHSSVLFSGSKTLLEKVKEIWCTLEDLGKSKCGLFNVVVDHCCDIWNDAVLKEALESKSVKGDEGTDCLDAFLDLITNACVFGQLQKKVSRIIQQGIRYFAASFDLGVAQSNNINIDYKVRWAVTKMLLNVSKKRPAYVINVLEALIEKDRRLSEQSRRYYDNSLTHRQKLRIWQTILVLCGCIGEENAAGSVNNALSVMVNENQPSIRYYIEWFVVTMVNKFPHLRGIIWDRLKEATERRVCSVTCLMSIIGHLTVVLDDDEFSDMASEAFSKLLPWVQIHHMQARVHAQIVLYKVWEETKRRNCVKVMHNFSLIESLFSLKESNASVFKATNDLRNHFYFKTFHPIRHYSLETIFCTLPRLLKVGEDEVINRAQLTEITLGNFEHNGLKIFDENPSLANAVHIGDSVEEDSVAPCPEASSPTETNAVDVQKKITAWKPLPPTEDPFLQKADMYKKEMMRSQMILCASLVDRTPNLGGLCRTCEIFGVDTLVIGAMRYLDDSNFKSLSVTAEKWMNIEQVLPRHLKVYLEEMKCKGYRLVGIEQTANSKSLQDYEFHEKTILLLGNEREGIPVSLIQMLDDCVEIPQQGVIRSLNVHVSGAIAVWEYCRQRLFKSE